MKTLFTRILHDFELASICCAEDVEFPVRGDGYYNRVNPFAVYQTSEKLRNELQRVMIDTEFLDLETECKRLAMETFIDIYGKEPVDI